MSQAESGKTPPKPNTIVVDPLGNAETEDSRVPQPIIHREQLSPQRLETRVDLNKVGGSSGEHVVYIVLQDFGLPFRTITIERDFITDRAGGEDSVESDGVIVACESRGWNSRTETHIVDNDTEEGNIVLKPGQHVFFAHDWYSSDFRTGFIMNDAQILAFKDKWKDPEEIKKWASGYTPIIKITYEGNVLIFTVYDDTTADVIYEKMVSQADSVIAGADTADRTREQVLEVALARSKKLLIEVQGKLQDALFENERLKREGARAQAFEFQPERTTSDDPYGYCNVLGINPGILFEMPPQDAERVVIGLRRIYSTIFHPDVSKQVDPEAMARINDATDKILTRIKTGSWERN